VGEGGKRGPNSSSFYPLKIRDVVAILALISHPDSERNFFCLPEKGFLQSQCISIGTVLLQKSLIKIAFSTQLIVVYHKKL
jgi:hypothetical protein